MKITFTGSYDICLKKERERITKGFRGPKWKGARDRQRAILDALESGDLDKAGQLYNKLPRCEHLECSEKEYTGLWMGDVIGMCGPMNRYVVSNITLTKD